MGEAGYGAIYELARIVDTFTTIDEPDVTINVGLVAGGADATVGDDGSRAVATGKVNVVARSAVARGDLRTTSLEQDARVRATMTAITAAHRAGTGAALTFIEGYPPMAATSGNRAILVQLNAVNDRLGLAHMGEVPPTRRGAGDAGFVSAHIPTLGGLGAAGSGSHAPGESLDLSSIARQALRSAGLVSRLASRPAPRR